MKIVLTVLLMAAGAVLAAASANARYTLDFTLVNETGYTIVEVFVSPARSNNWEEDVLGRDVLENGERLEIAFPKEAKGCKWDLMVTYDDDEQASWEDFDLCSLSKIELRYDRNTNSTWAEYE